MKRRLVFCPQFNPSSVVLLFEKGTGGESWSVRDYSQPGTISTRYAKDFTDALSSYVQDIRQSWDAPVVSVSDFGFWHNLTVEKNQQLGLEAVVESDFRGKATEQRTSTSTYDIYNAELLAALPKSQKSEDMKRLLHSPNSEDWVTWNVFALVQKFAPEVWWRHLVRTAYRDHPNIDLPQGWDVTPAVHLWRCVPSPTGYEKLSRARMQASGIPNWLERLGNPGPVEGKSEIDITLHNNSMTVFIEAKLGSDISPNTTYDPTRNQIARNVDCLIDDARNTTPLFWMLVRDAKESRMYTQVVKQYQEDPAILCRLLPHRDPDVIIRIAHRMSIILWQDFVKVLPQRLDDGLAASVRTELGVRMYES